MRYGIRLYQICEFLTELPLFGHFLCLAAVFGIISMLDYIVSYVEVDLPPMHQTIIRNVARTLTLYIAVLIFAHAYVMLAHSLSS